jgi:hypothetical protein
MAHLEPQELFVIAWKRPVWAAALILAIVGIAVVFGLRSAKPSRTSVVRDESQDPAVAAIRRPNDEISPTTSDDDPRQRLSGVPMSVARTRARAERNAVRERISRALSTAPTPHDQQAPPADDPDRPGDLKDRVGGRSALVSHLNREYMPLARDCIQQAQERSPELQGMLTLAIATAADELGAVVESAEVPAGSAVQEDGLTECLRESAMTLTFPPPLTAGREQFQLTLRIEPPRGPPAHP